nr:hypothetical protein [Tanacetum cinerariifolium]
MHNNIMAARSRDRPPMLAPGRYARWQSCFLRYIDTIPNGDALRKCILEGPYQLTTVIIPVVPATNDSLVEFGKFTSHDRESTESYCSSIKRKLMKSVLRIAKNANPLVLVVAAQQYPDPYYQAPKSHKSYATPLKKSSSTRSNASTKYKGKEIAKPITPPSESSSEEDGDPEQAQRDKDMQNNLALIAKILTVARARETVGSQQADWLADMDDEIDAQELEAHYGFMEKIQEVLPPESNSTVETLEQTELEKYMTFNDRIVDYYKLERKLNETLGLLAQKEIDIKEGLKLKAYKISVVKEKHDELVKQSLLAKPHYEGLVKEKTKVITDLKSKEEKDIGNIISIEKQLKFLNEIVYKRNQSIQTIHVLALKGSTSNGKLTFANPMYLKKAQSKKSCLYEILCDTFNLANRFTPDRKETLTLEKESRSKLDKDLVKPYDYTKQNSLYENFKPTLKEYHDQLAHAMKLGRKEIHKTNVCRPQLRSTQKKDKVVPNNSQVKNKMIEVEDHPRISSISNKTKSVTACNDSLKSRTLNVNVVCATCGNCLFNSDHYKFLNDVKYRTKTPN